MDRIPYDHCGWCGSADHCERACTFGEATSPSLTIRYRTPHPHSRCLLPPIDWSWWQAARLNPQPWSPAANAPA